MYLAEQQLRSVQSVMQLNPLHFSSRNSALLSNASPISATARLFRKVSQASAVSLSADSSNEMQHGWNETEAENLCQHQFVYHKFHTY
jgi:4-alpha-glucanotransferase